MRLCRSQSWVWWLLPFLVARALVPVGFMARVADGHLSMVFCSVGSLGLQAANHKTPVTGAHSDGSLSAASDDQDDSTQTDFSCPFSQGVAVPLLDVSGSEAVPYIATVEIVPLTESPYYAAGPPRFIATRGPPVLA